MKPDKQADDSLRLQHCLVALDTVAGKVNIALHQPVQAEPIDFVGVVVVDTNPLMDEFVRHSKYNALF